MVTTKQKSVLNTQKIIRKKPKHTFKERHRDTKENSTRRKKKQINTKPSEKINKMIISKHLSIINLHTSGLYFPVQRQTKG